MTSLVQAWANQQRPLLRQYGPRDGRTQFLRIVSRVYVTGPVSATVSNDEAFSGEARGGADRPVELLGLTKGNADKNYSDAPQTLNKFVSDKLPGGKVKIAAAAAVPSH